MHLRRCILIHENLPNSLQGNAQFKVSLLEIKGAEIYKFTSHLICFRTGMPREHPLLWIWETHDA